MFAVDKMDIYPLAEQNSPKKVDSIGLLNTFGIHCLIDEIQKHECLFSTSSNEEKSVAWFEIQKNLENIVKGAIVTNIKFTWQTLLANYSEWKANPKSKASLHILFEKMKFLEGKEKNIPENKDLKELQDAPQTVEIKKAQEPSVDLKLPQSPQFTFALIESVKKATYLRSGANRDEYEVSLAMTHPTLGAIGLNMAQAGFSNVEDKDIIPTWTRLLEIHGLGKTGALNSGIGKKICEKLAFVDQKPVRLARKIYQRYNHESRQFDFVTPVAKREERRRVAAAKAVEPKVPENQFPFWFYLLSIVFIVFAVIYGYIFVETSGIDFKFSNLTYYKGVSA